MLLTGPNLNLGPWKPLFFALYHLSQFYGILKQLLMQSHFFKLNLLSAAAILFPRHFFLPNDEFRLFLLFGRSIEKTFFGFCVQKSVFSRILTNNLFRLLFSKKQLLAITFAKYGTGEKGFLKRLFVNTKLIKFVLLQAKHSF